jgi:Ring finger domain
METRRRRIPTCGYCGQEGHNVRSCCQPDMLQLRRHFKNIVRNHERLETIRSWLNEINNTKLLKMVVMQYIRIGFHSVISKPDMVERTMQFVYEQHRHELQEKVANVNMYIRQLDHMQVALTPQMLCESYAAYFREAQIPDEEHALVCAVVLDMPQVNMVIEYIVLARLECYLANMIREITQQIMSYGQDFRVQDIRVIPIYVEPVKYVYEESNTPPPLNTDPCPICFDDLKWRDTYTTECGHHFCHKCIQSTIKQIPNTTRCPCPMCRTPLAKLYYYDMQKYTNHMDTKLPLCIDLTIA